MPKKFATENSKAVAARERKKASNDAVVSQKKRQEDEEYWKDDDKSIKKKQQRKEEQDRKREQQLTKKAESKQLLEEEMNSIKAKKPAAPSKVTRSQISHQTPKQVEKVNKVVNSLDEPLHENINRLEIEGEEARTVDEAIGILNSKSDELDKHPEKRMKALYTLYETQRLAELKLENPSLRLSQLKQIVFKDWQKAPENPLNQQ